MADYQERPTTTTTVIEKRSGGTALAVLLLVIVVAIAAFLVSSESRKDSAVEGAATQVGQAASDVSGAAQSATGGKSE